MRSPKTTWDKARIQHLLDTNDIAIERAVLVVFNNQTVSEQQTWSTNKDNGVGFNGTDAKFMSSLANFIMNSRNPEGRRLTPGQRPIARKIMMKYWGQIQAAIIEKEYAQARREDEILGQRVSPEEDWGEIDLVTEKY